VQIWAELLGTQRIGIRDDFFALGGHSLLTIRLVASIQRALGVQIPVAVVFNHPTVEALAGYVASHASDANTCVSYVRTGLTEARAATPQQYFWYLDRDDHDPASYYMIST